MSIRTPQPLEDGYVECGECGHPIEAHDRQGCCACGGECPCLEAWTEAEIRRVRRREGLPGIYDPVEIAG
jgi:hypothetical protein